MLSTRWATTEDDAALLALDSTAWDSSSGFPSTFRPRDAFFTTTNPPEAHLVAEEGERLLGYVKLAPWTPLPENAHVLGVQGLAVAPDARGRGVGSALLEAAEREARARGARKLRLGVLASNPRARALYERHGWVVEGLLRGEWQIDGVDVDDVWMARYLDA